MSTIRSFLPQTLPAQAGLEPSRARSAQNAFFQAAMGQTTTGLAAPTQAAAQPLPSAAVASVMRTATPSQPVAAAPVAQEREAPRLMRPGSLLDIRI